MNDTLALANEVPRLRVPARIVRGAANQFRKFSYGERLARDRHTPLARIEGGKHFTPEDRPNIFAEEVNDLLREVKRSGERRA